MAKQIRARPCAAAAWPYDDRGTPPEQPQSQLARHAPEPGDAAMTLGCGTHSRVQGLPTKPSPRPPVLDARLRAAADWVAPCGVCADIGCDHGRLGAVLLLENRCQNLLAADVSAKALAKAETRLTALGMLARVSFAVADGLDALATLPGGRADVICILGMGGETVAGILRRGYAQLRGAKLILGAQTELPVARAAVESVGYRFAQERIVQAEGRLYTLMLAQPAPQGALPYTQRELLLGPCLLRERPATWQPWLAKRAHLLQQAMKAMRASGGEGAAERLGRFEAELAMTCEALAVLAKGGAPIQAEGGVAHDC